MCLIAFAIDQHPDYPFILIGNRDEFYARDTAPLHWWDNHQDVLGGRDLEAGGTWLAMSRQGKIAAVTNYRDPKNEVKGRKSRGGLPVNYLISDQRPQKYLSDLHKSDDIYNGYNLLVGYPDELWHYSNYEEKFNQAESGVFAISNGLLDSPWPKVRKIREGLRERLEGQIYPEKFLDLLMDREEAPEEILPDTGIGIEWEKKISMACIRLEKYGTNCSTVILIDKNDEVTYYEKTYAVGPKKAGERIEKFRIEL